MAGLVASPPSIRIVLVTSSVLFVLLFPPSINAAFGLTLIAPVPPTVKLLLVPTERRTEPSSTTMLPAETVVAPIDSCPEPLLVSVLPLRLSVLTVPLGAESVNPTPEAEPVPIAPLSVQS